MIKAIETRYAGCHFRSRLEARWAVFFDALKIRWEYEPEGFVCSTRVSDWLSGETFNYLPDFLLPDLNLWAEVKGSLDRAALVKVLDAAASLGDPCGHGRDTVVLGPIPAIPANPYVLHMHKGTLSASSASLSHWAYGVRDDMFCRAYGGYVLAEDSNGVAPELLPSPEWLLKPPAPLLNLEIPPAARRAFVAARSARFEHGRSGAR